MATNPTLSQSLMQTPDSADNNSHGRATSMINGSVKVENATFFKAKITGLPSSYCLEDFKKWLNEEQHVSFVHLTVLQSAANIAIGTCSDESSLEVAIKTIDKSQWRGNVISCSKASPADLKRKASDKPSSEPGSKKLRLKFTPREKVFWYNCANQHLPYKDQLAQLYEEVRVGSLQLGSVLINHNPDLASWWHNQLHKHKGDALLLQKVVASPVVDGYRNKYDFKIGQDPDSKEPVVGLKVDNQSDYSVSVKPGDEFKQFPDIMKHVVVAFDKYIKESSLQPYSSSGGYWRNLVVRVAANNEVLVMVVFHPQELSNKAVEDVQSDLVDFLANRDGKSCNVVSLYFKLYSLYTDKNYPQSNLPPTLLWGKPHIIETMPNLRLSFVIGPASFFQVNRTAGEKLYSAVAELAHVDQETSVIDLCCASGGITLTLAKKAKEVFGIDISESSVHDAKVNAEKNEVTNCEFFVGRAEEVLSIVLKRITGTRVVVVCDPPRDGLGQSCINELRRCQKLSKIVYLVSSQRVIHKNFIDLCLPNFLSKSPGKPFVPVRGIPVDLAPHTLHCCLVLLLERIDPMKYEVLSGGAIPLHPIPPMMGPCGPHTGPLPLLGPCVPSIPGQRGPLALGPMGPCPPLGAPRACLKGAPRGHVPRPLPGPGLRGPRPLGIRPLVRGMSRVGPRPPQPPSARLNGRPMGMISPRSSSPGTNGGDNFYQDDPLDGPSFFGPESDVQPPLPAKEEVFW